MTTTPSQDTDTEPQGTPPRARCPRCGYDVSGAFPTWTTQCPLNGRCPECGLEFSWRNLLNPAYSRTPRFVESRRTPTFRDILLTGRRAWRPYRFWRWVPIEQPIEWRPMAIGVTAMVVGSALATTLTWALAALALGIVHARLERYPLAFGLEFWWDELSWRLEQMGGLAEGAVFLMSAFVATPIAFLLLTDSWRHIRVRRAHLFRIGAYSLVALPPFLLLMYWAIMMDAFVVGTWRGLGFTNWDEADALATRIYDGFSVLATFAPFLWLVAWWRAAAKHYLRLAHPGGVAVLLVVVAGLIAYLISVLHLLAMQAVWMGRF